MENFLESEFVAVVFITVGLGIGFLEFFVPSGGILGVIAFLSCSFGVVCFFWQGHPWVGAFAVLAMLVAVIAFVRFAIRRVSFAGNLATSSSVDERIGDLVGKEGVAASELRPAGIAVIDGKRVDVVSSGGFVPADTPVRVVDNTGNRVVVAEIRRPASRETPEDGGNAL